MVRENKTSQSLSNTLPKITNSFNGQIWLNDAEWKTYLKRMPVRYLKLKKQLIDRDGADCAICGKPETIDQPLQIAHKIGFRIGVIGFGLTPDYLDGIDNVALAHRGKCNNKVELSPLLIGQRLLNLDLHLEKSPAVKNGLTFPTYDKTGNLTEIKFSKTAPAI